MYPLVWWKQNTSYKRLTPAKGKLMSPLILVIVFHSFWVMCGISSWSCIIRGERDGEELDEELCGEEFIGEFDSAGEGHDGEYDSIELELELELELQLELELELQLELRL